MLTFRYRKIGAAAFIPHIDTLRALIRTIRRANIPVSYSQGFNPHMNLYMSPPMPLGFESVSEYCTADTVIAPKDFYEAFNNNCIRGMECTEVYSVVKNPNIAAAAYAADYAIKSEWLRDNFDNIINKKEFTITYARNGITESKQVIKDIIGIEKTNNGIIARLRFGNMGNLRIDRFLQALNCGDCNAVKTLLLCSYNKRVYNADEYIKIFGS